MAKVPCDYMVLVPINVRKKLEDYMHTNKSIAIDNCVKLQHHAYQMNWKFSSPQKQTYAVLPRFMILKKPLFSHRLILANRKAKKLRWPTFLIFHNSLESLFKLKY